MDFLDYEEKILPYLKGGLIAIPFISWFISIVYGSFHWLKYGMWNEFTTCEVANLFCYNNTEFIGIDKILNWYGSHDVTFTLATVSVILYFGWLKED